MQYPTTQDTTLPQTSQTVEQRDRVKQTGGIDIDHDHDVEHHEASTMNTLSVENLSHPNLDHDAGEIIHKGWEKATDTIASGVEVIKRLIMQELPPVEGENLMEKAENLKDIASEKVQEVKEKVQEKVESAKQSTEELSSQASETKVEAKSEIKQQGQELQRGARSSQQTDLYRSDMGSTHGWQPTQEMKDIAREKLGEFKEKFNNQGDRASGRGEEEGSYTSESTYQSQQQPSGSVSHPESAIIIEHGHEQELSASSNKKIQEVEDLSYQLSQKVEELKRTAAIPTSENTETIIIIQQGGQEGLVSGQPGQTETQFSKTEESYGTSQGEGQQRPKLGHRGEQEWRSQEAPSSQGQEQQRPKLGHRGEQEWRGQEAPSSQGQEQQRPKLGHRDEQEWRGQEAPEQGSGPSGKDFSEKITEKAQELKEGFRQGYDKGFEKAGSHMPSSEGQQQHPKMGHKGEQTWKNQQGEGQTSEGGQSFAGKVGDKIKEKAGEKITELKDSYQSNLQELERKAEQRRSEQPKEHHESEHHLTIESESFKPSAESKSLLKKELLGDQQESLSQGPQGGFSQGAQGNVGQSHPEGSEHHLSASSESFKPSSQSKSLLKKELGQGEQGGSKGLGSNLKGKLNQATEQIKDKDLGSNLKGKLNEAAEQIKDKVLPSGEASQGKPLKEQISEKISEITDKITPLAEAEKQHGQPEGHSTHVQAPPAEMKETITYHPRDIRGYEVEYVPKSHGEGQESTQSKGEQESKSQPESKGQQASKDQQESKPVEERVPLLDRIQHGVENVSHTYQNIKGLFKPGQATEEGQKGSEQKESGNRARAGSAADSQLPQDSGKKQGGSRSRSGSQNVQVAAPPAEMKETITYHPRDIRGYEVEYVPKSHGEGQESQTPSGQQGEAAPVEIKEHFTYHPREVPGYEIEYVPKGHEEGEHTQSQASRQETEKGAGQETEQKPVDTRVPLVDRVSHGLEAVKSFFHHSPSQPKESSGPQPSAGASQLSQILESQADVLKTKYSALKDIQPQGEGLVSSGPQASTDASQLSQIIESQAEVLKTKYSALKDDQPHGEGLIGAQSGQKGQEGQESQSQEGREHKGIFGRVSGALHTITDKFSHGGSNLEGKVEQVKEKAQPKEEPKKAESPREKIYEFNPKAKKTEEKTEEKTAEVEEKSGPGFISKISGKISHGIEGVKGKFQHGKEESSEETSTEKKQSVVEKIQGKIQGKETGEEVDKEGFRTVHDGFSESVVELKKEQNEQYHEQVVVANENPFEPLNTKAAALIDHPVTSTELVGGNLKNLTADFDENAQEMIPEDKDEQKDELKDEQKRGLLQKVKEGIFSKFSHGAKENEANDQ